MAADRRSGDEPCEAETTASRSLPPGAGDGTERTLAPDRMRQVLHRITTNHYDQPEVLGRIASRVARELGLA